MLPWKIKFVRWVCVEDRGKALNRTDRHKLFCHNGIITIIAMIFIVENI
jgi:hypothetical protein